MKAFQNINIFPLKCDTEPLRQDENIFSFKVLSKKYEPHLKEVC
jgi:hypothetical protein